MPIHDDGAIWHIHRHLQNIAPSTKWQTAHIKCAINIVSHHILYKEYEYLNFDQKWLPISLLFYRFQHLTAMAAGLLVGQNSYQPDVKMKFF
jgi:hypothetical protein